MKPETRIFFKSPRGKKLKKKIEKEVSNNIPSLLKAINRAIQNDSLYYGIYYKKINNYILNNVGYHLDIYFDYENLKFYYSLYRLKNKVLLKTFIIKISS